MGMFDLLDDSTFRLYAARVYKNSNNTTVQEFDEDLNRIKYLGRLFKRYHLHDDLQERLILNHIIVLFNVFDIEGALKLVFFKTERDHWPYLKTFLIYANFLSDNALVEVPLDQEIISRLRAI